MSDKPISDFFSRMHSFHPDDVAVLWALLAYQEVSGGENGVISPSVAKRAWCVDLPSERLQESISRLLAAGELEWVSDNHLQGYLVVRFNELLDSMTEFGMRRYNRLKARERRDERLRQAAALVHSGTELK